MGGLELKLFLAVGSRVMLTRNLWTEKGLCNRSMGNISDIVYNQGDQPPALPIAVIVKSDSTYTRPRFFLTYLDMPLLYQKQTSQICIVLYMKDNSYL